MKSGIKTENQKTKTVRRYRDKKWLKERYINERLSTYEIAKLCKCSHTTIFHWLHKFNIETRKGGDINHLLDAKNAEMSNELKNILEGHILGDAALSKYGKSARLDLASNKRNYLEWNRKILERNGVLCSDNLTRKKRTNYKEKRPTYDLHSLCYREFLEMEKKWYPNGKKVIPEDFKISPISIFLWYIDDGTKYLQSKNNRHVKIYAKTLANYLYKAKRQLENIGISCSTPNDSKPGTKALYIYQKSQEDFFDYILDHPYNIPQSYDYKFPEEKLKCQN